MTRFRLPQAGLTAVVTDLRHFGEQQVESIAFGVGRRRDGVATVARVVLPEEPGVTRRFGFLHLSERWMLRLTEFCESVREAVIMQFHSHPYGAEHSDTDDHHLFHSPGILSAVIPDFAQNETAEGLTGWAAYECLNGGAFVEADLAILEIVDDPVEVVAVSEDRWRSA